MKQKMLSPIVFLVVLLSWLTWTPPDLPAQGGPYPVIDPTTGLPLPAPELEFPGGVLDTLEFDNVPLMDVVATLREKFPEVNFVLPQSPRYEGPELFEAIPVRFKLRKVGLKEILTAVTYATDMRVGWTLADERLVVFHTQEQAPSTPPELAPPPPPQPPAKAEYMIMNFANVLRTTNTHSIDVALEQILDVVDRTTAELEAFGPGNRIEPPRLRYHPGSGLLVIMGSRDGIKLAMEVVQNYRSTSIPKLGRPPMQESGSGDAPHPPEAAPPPPSASPKPIIQF